MHRNIVSLLLLLSLFLHISEAAALEIMLPQIYKENIDIAGWLLSEKLDGVRGYWTGQQLLSKHGKQFHPPTEFTKNFPPFALEGEIWGGRGTFEPTVSTVMRQAPHSGWLTLKFAIFDVPEANGDFMMRIEKAKQWFDKNQSKYAFVIQQTPVQGKEALTKELERVENLGGEGLIVRKPNTLYDKGRSADILKIKSFQDAEAVVKAHIPGTGRNKGRMGSILVELPDGKRCKIGSGFSDQKRQNPPPIGSIITFKHYDVYHSGLPKFPSFLRIRSDTGL